MSGLKHHNVDLVARYEALRAHALGSASAGWTPLGLAILRHRGMAAWMAAEECTLLGRQDERPESDRHSQRKATCAPEPELVRLLANAALKVIEGTSS